MEPSIWVPCLLPFTASTKAEYVTAAEDRQWMKIELVRCPPRNIPERFTTAKRPTWNRTRKC